VNPFWLNDSLCASTEHVRDHEQIMRKPTVGGLILFISLLKISSFQRNSQVVDLELFINVAVLVDTAQNK
jgi:hypothetical protein